MEYITNVYLIMNYVVMVVVFAKYSILRDRPTNEREARAPAPKARVYRRRWRDFVNFWR